jgi:hypothetical protein
MIMRKSYLTLVLFAGIIGGTNAQQCFIDSAVNIAPLLDSVAIFTPPSDSLACMVRGQQVSDTLYFTIFNRLSGFVLDSVTIDSVNNLPDGICWMTNSADNTFGAGQNGVLYLSGVTYVGSGQYKLQVYISATTTAFPIPPANLETATGIRYYVRLICPGDACPPIDTTGGKDSLFIPYNTPACGVGIREVSNALSDLSVQPDPFFDRANVSLRSDVAGPYTMRTQNIVGAVVSAQDVMVARGSNNFTIERNGLSPGIYILSISGSTGSVNKKILIVD